MKIKLLYFFLAASLPAFAQTNSNLDGKGADASIKFPSSHRAASFSQSHVVDSIRLPLDWVGDITFDHEGNIWVGTGQKRLLKIASTNGQILDTIATTIETPDGLTFDGKYLWVAESLRDKTIQKIDPTTGEVVFSFTHTTNNYATHGMTYVNQQLWVNMFFEDDFNWTYTFDTLGNFKTRFLNHCESSHGIAFDGNNFWISANRLNSSQAVVYKYSEDFTIIDSISVPGGKYPNGLDFHDGHLWLSNAGANKIYKISIDTPTASKEPQLENQIVLFPNPSHKEIYIKPNAQLEGCVFEIFDANGRQVLRHELVNNEPISLEELQAGMYFYYFRNDSGIVNQGKLGKYQ